MRRSAHLTVITITAECEGADAKEKAALNGRQSLKTFVWVRSLEAELRTYRNAQIVMRSVVEENVVARFQTHSDRSGECFHAATRVERKIRRPVSQSHAIGEACGSVDIRHAEIVEADFAGYEQSDRSGTGLKFRSEETVQRAQARRHIGRRQTIAERAGIVAFEVVRHFRFHLDIGRNAEGRAPAQSDEISRRTRIGQAVIVRESTNFDVIHRTTFLRDEHRRGEEKGCYQ